MEFLLMDTGFPSSPWNTWFLVILGTIDDCTILFNYRTTPLPHLETVPKFLKYRACSYPIGITIKEKSLPSHLETAALIPKVDVNTVLSHEPTDLPTRAFASSYKW